ncbi:MAG: YitT family protein [Ruminococcaceae bacterium]|nr:YitT family protein [Oscillospiraceae bacterium]
MKIKPSIAMILGGMILAFGIYNIHSISPVTEGGTLGLILLCEHWLSVSPAISGFFLNALCYGFGWCVFGNKFIGYSAIAGISFSGFYALFELFPPLFPQIANYPIIASVAGAVFVGIGVGVAVRFGGAPTGDDAIAMGVSEKTGLDIKWIYLISDGVVLLLSLTYIPMEKILYSLITVIISGQIISAVNSIGKGRKNPKTKGLSDKEDACVLVGTTKGPMQLLTAMKYNFYHIPAIRISKDMLPIKFVAIYQSVSKFGKDAGVTYYGEVVKCSRLKRRKIREIPKESDALYYRFDVKSWEKLQKPIVTNGKDIISITTTLSALLESHTTTELLLKDKRERLIYRAVSGLISQNADTIDFEDAFFTLEEENITVYKQGKVCFLFSKQDFVCDPVSITKIIANMLYK